MTSSETPIEQSSYGEKLQYDPEFKGPIKSRSCTDIFCLFLFVSFLAGWLVVAFFAYREGDPRTLLYPTDSLGNMCGTGNLTNKKYLYYFDILQCANPKVLLNGCPTPQVCVEQCPNETFHAGQYMNNPDKLRTMLICKYGANKQSKDVAKLLEDEDCASLYLKSISVVNRCVPEIFLQKAQEMIVKDKDNHTLTDNDGNRVTVDVVKNATGNLAGFLSVREMGEKLFIDFKRSREYIVLGLVMSMGLSLIWIVLMRYIAGIMVWISIVAVLGFSAFGCYYSSSKYIELKDVPGSDAKFRLTFQLKSYLALRNTWLAFAIITGIVFAILFLVVIYLRDRIAIAIELIKEASKAVSHMITCLLFPLVPYIMMLTFFLFWIVVSLYIASSGKASFVVANAPNNSQLENGSTCMPKELNESAKGAKCLFSEYGVTENIYSAHAYNLFGLFWGLFFAVGIGQVSLAGAFASYYWTLDKKNIPRFAIAIGFWNCIRYHMGSVAFGSLLIAIVRFIRVVLEYIDYQLKKYDNKFVKWLMWCLRCCFWLLENILKYVSKNAFIMVAIYGKTFCNSAKHAFMLLMRNVVRFVVIDKVTDFLLFMGKLVVVAASACVSFYLFATDQKVYRNLPQLNYYFIPPIFITFGSYIISSAFFNVYGMAVDTLFLCFLEDAERNDGSPEKPYYMTKGLMKILDKRNRLKEPVSPKL